MRAVSGEPASFSARVGDREQRRRGLETDEFERAENLELLDVFRQVARGHPLVDVLVACQLAEFLDARLHIVPRDALALHDGVEVDSVPSRARRPRSPRPGSEPEGALRLHHGDPELAFEPDLPSADQMAFIAAEA